MEGMEETTETSLLTSTETNQLTSLAAVPLIPANLTTGKGTKINKQKASSLVYV
jgi:hypothetical protein